MSEWDEGTRVKEVLGKSYARKLMPDETGGYVASIQEFPGCIAEGETAEEALHNLNTAAASWVSVALANGFPIREPVDFDGFSGKIALRIPRGLHKQVAELAEQEECSINQLLVSAIAHYVGGKQVTESMLLALKRTMSDGLVTIYRQSPWMIGIVFPEAPKNYLTGTTYEGQTLASKTFSLGVTG